MSLLPGSTTAPSLSQRKINQRVKIDAIIADVWNTMCRGQQDGIDAFWHAPGLTPQDMSDAYGTDAGKLFAFHAALTDLIIAQSAVEGISPPPVKAPTNAFTVNQDGTVTISEDPYVP